MTDGEYKFFDKGDLDDPVQNTGLVFPSLNNVPQGTRQSERKGNWIIIKSIRCAWTYELIPATDLVSRESIRTIVYLDRQFNGNTDPVTATKLLKTANILSPYNLDNSQRFKILYDKTHTLVATAGVAGAYNNKVIYKEWHKRCNILIKFDEDSPVSSQLARIRSNNIGVFYITSTGFIPGSGGGALYMSQQHRIRYHD